MHAWKCQHNKPALEDKSRLNTFLTLFFFFFLSLMRKSHLADMENEMTPHINRVGGGILRKTLIENIIHE